MVAKRGNRPVSEPKSPASSKRIVHSPLHTDIVHPKEARRLRVEIRKKHGLDSLYGKIDSAKRSLDALHDNHKPSEVKVSEVFARGSQDRHLRLSAVHRSYRPDRRSNILTLTLLVLVILASGVFYLEYPENDDSDSLTGFASAEKSYSLGVLEQDFSVMYLFGFVLFVVLLVALLDIFIDKYAYL
jgi:hypothetical protein